jgi:N-acetylmuramoyl-L-alanine amidase
MSLPVVLAASRVGGTKRGHRRRTPGREKISLRWCDRQYRRWFGLLLAGLLAIPAISYSATSPARRERAIATFERAQRMHTTLESQPESKRSKSDYLRLIRTYYEVYRLNPHYSKAPVALAAKADLYEEMGRVFSEEKYFRVAVDAYQFVVREYPVSPASRDALFTLGEVYLSDLHNPQEARNTFQQYLHRYPRHDKTHEARERLKQIDQLLAEHVKKEEPSPEPAPSRQAGGLPVVTAIRRWVGPNYSRVVIGVEGEVKFDTIRLANPDRIVLDLENSRLSPELIGKSFPIEDGYLKQIRVGQYTPQVSRIVLDVAKLEDYSIFSLPNPFRLVIDIHGTSQELTAKAKTPPSRKGATKSAPKASATSAATVKKDAREKQSASLAKRPEPSGERDKTAAVVVPPIKPAAPTVSGSQTLTRALGLKIGRIVIDPGHGGHDTGTIGPTGLREKDVVLDVGLRLKKLLEKNTGCEVIMTRSDDTFIPLEERTAIANEKGADLFISIHANASRDPDARGVETYYLNFTSNPDALEVAARENATSQESVHQLQDLIKKIALTEKVEESQDFARLVQREVYRKIARTGGSQRNRGVKKAPFVVLIGANMPSILAEISFLSNPRDERLLRRASYRESIAEALYKGVLDYVKNLGEVKTVQRAASQETSTSLRPDF